MEKLTPVTPGKLLLEEFSVEMGHRWLFGLSNEVTRSVRR